MKLLAFSSVAALSDVDKLGIIGDYHVRSSHTRTDGYCPMPDAFDWPSMPGPRVYYDSERHALPLSIAVDAAPAASVSALLLACCGASGVKADGNNNRWYVRSNPSSGNLHPVETYVLVNTAPLPLRRFIALAGAPRRQRQRTGRGLQGRRRRAAVRHLVARGVEVRP